ncbi:acyl-CoA dehydrogenase [Rhodobium gokarnense]|uniref:3-methylfumaryl-CoA hydratase n=1 Tax=Rhodobium gokarnense TaxID=364296 RepID=A0ABT3HIJ2_9HYPH|nr:acyl-CoA dehydrogenase [Rhodobium gokarnense]MCW2310220.1 3-methylfumaryl-CoA hydratase [Rhodobium gokarnense]
MTDYSDWIGRETTVEEYLATAPAERLAATLDAHGAGHPLQAGDAVPPLWHWLYFMPVAAQGDLGPDGHPATGGFIPPVPLPRRMYAGGRITQAAQLRFGAPAAMTSRIDSVVEKNGRSGPLVFVTLSHEVHQDGKLCVRDEQDIVYREMVSSGAAPASKMGTRPTAWTETVTPDPVMLFRFSAVTFNGHRIHYDRNHATETEGYPGLVVHGPMIAMLLLEAAERRRGAICAYYEFRAMSPLFDTDPFDLVGIEGETNDTVELEARAKDGRIAMVATARFV